MKTKLPTVFFRSISNLTIRPPHEEWKHYKVKTDGHLYLTVRAKDYSTNEY